MVRKLLIIFFFVSKICYSQSIIKLLDAQTKEPIKNIYVQILKNQKTYFRGMIPDNKGIIKTKLPFADSNSSYQLSINSIKYIYLLKTLDLSDRDTLILKVKKNPYFLEDSPDYFSSQCGTVSGFDYKVIRSFKGLPKPIAHKIKRHLEERLGTSLAKDFELINGQMFDIKQLKSQNSNLEYNTYYRLCFSYRNLKAGISMYSSTLELDENGNVMKDIDFPLKTGNSYRKVSSFSEIKKKALTSGFYNTKTTTIDIAYLDKENILVWRFTNKRTIDDEQILREQMLFDLRNSKYLRTDSTKIFYVN